MRKGEAQDLGRNARVAFHPLAQPQAFALQMLFSCALEYMVLFKAKMY